MRLRLAGVLFSLALVFWFGGCGGSGGGGAPDTGLVLGVALSPRGHSTGSTTSDWIDHYQNHAVFGRAIAFHGIWRDSVAAAGQIPALAKAGMAAAATYGFVPMIGFGWTDGAGNPDLTSVATPGDNSWNNPQTQVDFVKMVTDFCTQYQPRFVFLGNETNAYFVNHSMTEWAAWLAVLKTAYDSIKAKSPSTLVMTNFQYELMRGGGSKNGWTYSPNWSLLSGLSDRVDAISFTSYPYFDFDGPASIPATYYSDISTYWNGPVAFTELAWPAAGHAPYPGSTADQSAFVNRFFDLTTSLDVRYAAWLFVHDWDGQATTPAFQDVGFRSNNGTVVRPAEATWRLAVQANQGK